MPPVQSGPGRPSGCSPVTSAQIPKALKWMKSDLGATARYIWTNVKDNVQKQSQLQALLGDAYSHIEDEILSDVNSSAEELSIGEMSTSAYGREFYNALQFILKKLEKQDENQQKLEKRIMELQNGLEQAIVDVKNAVEEKAREQRKFSNEYKEDQLTTKARIGELSEIAGRLLDLHKAATEEKTKIISRLDEESKILPQNLSEHKPSAPAKNATISIPRQTEEAVQVPFAETKCDSGTTRESFQTSNKNATNGSMNLPQKEQEDNSAIIENFVEDNCKTIVLFGETGTGKSSLLNSFTNFAIFSSFYEAKKNGPAVLIETKFTYVDEYSYSREVHMKPTVFEKRPENTSFSEKGESVTQFATSYLFSYSNGEKQHYLRIVDTPGINDTRGEEQDRFNVENVLNYIARFEKISAILIVVPSNVKRFTPTFRYNLETLMNQLHRSVARNIVFGFTQSSLTLFNHGDTYNVLEEFFKNVKDISISKDNSFMFDNECYRYLCQKSRGYKCSIHFQTQASISWYKSISEFERLLRHIFTLEQHKIANTFDVSFVKTFIQKTSRPIVEAMICLILNFDSLSDEQKKICSYPTQFFREKFAIHCVPSTVAEGKQGISTSNKHRTGSLSSDDTAHPKYIKYERSDDAVQTVLHEICCEKSKIHVASPSEEKTLAQEAYTKQTLIKNEYRELMLIICRFVIFLRQNSLTDFSNCFKACLKMVYEQEEIYVNEGGNRTRLSIVERIRRDYQNYFSEQHVLWINQKISIEEINDDFESLKRLTETGRFLSEAIAFQNDLPQKSSAPTTEPVIHCLPHIFPKGRDPL